MYQRQAEIYKITGKDGHFSYYKSLNWIEFYLQSCFGGLRELEIVETCIRKINGVEQEIIKLAYAHCGYIKNTYRVELINNN